MPDDETGDMIRRAEDADRAREMYENGIAAYHAGDHARATNLFHGATRLNPEKAVYYSYLGLAIAHRPSRFMEAREYCEKAIEMEPFNPQLYLNMAEVYKIAQKPEKAAKVYQDVLKLDPDNTFALMNLKQYAEEGTREESNRFEKLIRRLKE